MTTPLVRAQRVGVPVIQQNASIPKDREFRRYCYNVGVQPTGDSANVLFHVWRASARVHKERLLAKAVKIVLSCGTGLHSDPARPVYLEDIAKILEETL